MFKKFFRWVFREELNQLNELIEKKNHFDQLGKKIEQVLETLDVSVDVNIEPTRYRRSWAVISLQGEKTDFLKFIDLGESDLRDIQRFLNHYDIKNQKIDSIPMFSKGLKLNRF